MKLSELLTKNQLHDVEVFADKLWRKLGVDVKFTNHFTKRVNDQRNGKPINSSELIRLFKKEYEEYGHDIADLPKNHEAILKDLSTHLNLPFVIVDKPQGKEIVAKTIMRKDNFKSFNQEFPIK